MLGFRREDTKLKSLLLPVAVATVALVLAAPALARDDGALAASCDDVEAVAGQYQYCPGYKGSNAAPSRGGYGGYPQDPPPQYPPPQPVPREVIADLDGDGQPETSITVSDADGDGAVDEGDVTAVVGDVFFVYATYGSSLPADDGGAPADAPADAPEESGGSGGAPASADRGDGGIDAETTGGDTGGDDAHYEETGPDEETVGDAERVASSGGSPGGDGELRSGGDGEPRSGPGRVLLFALGAGTLLVANGLLARWIVG